MRQYVKYQPKGENKEGAMVLDEEAYLKKQPVSHRPL